MTGTDGTIVEPSFSVSVRKSTFFDHSVRQKSAPDDSIGSSTRGSSVPDFVHLQFLAIRSKDAFEIRQDSKSIFISNRNLEPRIFQRSSSRTIFKIPPVESRTRRAMMHPSKTLRTQRGHPNPSRCHQGTSTIEMRINNDVSKQ